MRPRLHVTEQERLCYSYRRLRALSRLREAGIEPGYSLYKEHPLPTSGRLGYRVRLPDGAEYTFQRLVDIEAFAADYALWQRTQGRQFALRVAFAAWQADALLRMQVRITAGLWEAPPSEPVPRLVPRPPTQAPCSWPECQYPATGVIEGQAFCAVHALIYGRIWLAQDGRMAGRSHAAGG